MPHPAPVADAAPAAPQEPAPARRYIPLPTPNGRHQMPSADAITQAVPDGSLPAAVADEILGALPEVPAWGTWRTDRLVRMSTKARRSQTDGRA